MKVIDLETCKALLGITDNSKDAAISAQIPIIDAKVKQICGTNFNLQVYGKFTQGSTKVEVYGTGCDRFVAWSRWIIDEMTRDLPTGTLLEGAPISPVSCIDEVFYDGYSDGGNVPYILMDKAATQNGQFYFYAGINKAYQGTIAKGIAWLMGQMNEDISDNAWESKSAGPLSVKKSARDSAIDGKSGMPAWFVKSLPRYHR